MLAELLEQYTCLKSASDERAIPSIARLDAWIYVTVVLMCDERNLELGDKQNKMEKKYGDPLSKHLALVVQQVFSSICNVSFQLKDTKLLMNMEVASSCDAKSNNVLQVCAKAVNISSNNRCCLLLTAESFKDIVSRKMRLASDRYIGWAGASVILESVASMRFQNMCVSM